MIITYHGGECFKVTAGDTTAVFGPISKQSKTLKPTNFGADVAFISREHPDMNGVEQVARAGNEPFVISGPGEYEIGAISAHGFQTVSHYGVKEPHINTMYAIHFDGLSLLYVGALGSLDMKGGELEDIDEVDVLIVPIGGDGVLSPAEAHKFAVKMEAKVVIPMHYGDLGEKDALKQLLKEAGAESVKPIDKISLKQKDVGGKSGEVIVLSA